MIKLTPSR